MMAWLNLETGRRYADLGSSGSAYTVVEAAKAGCHVVAANISLVGLAKAKRRTKNYLGSAYERCDFVACDMSMLPIKDGELDAVSAVAVLEHIDNDEEAVREMARVLRPGGRAYVNVPNSYRNLMFLVWPFSIVHDLRVGHIRHYREASLKAMFRSYHLVPVETSYTGHWFKLLQLICTVLGVADDRLWWNLEKLDQRMARVKTGLQLHLVLEKRTSSSEVKQHCES